MSRYKQDIPTIWTDGKPGIMRRHAQWRRDMACYHELRGALKAWKPPYVYLASPLLALYGVCAYFTPYFVATLAAFPILYYSTIGFMIGLCKLLILSAERAMENGRYGRIMRSDRHEFRLLADHLAVYGYNLDELVRTPLANDLIQDPIRDYLDSTATPRLLLRNNPCVDPASLALSKLQQAAKATALKIHEALQQYNTGFDANAWPPEI